MQIALFEPEIPPNTGNIARLCAATKTPLHLIEPLGFSLEDRHLKRAGLDYWPHVQVRVWPDWPSFVEACEQNAPLVLTSSKAQSSLFSFAFSGRETLVFGPETKGLPEWLLRKHPIHLRIPIWGHVRSLNISNAAAVCLYEAYRQAENL
jgi:tRNA (cytidine/uridine-2'-O-)-methyltransferase